MINRSYLPQVALIESQCEPRKKQPMITGYTKSPLRDRQNRMNLGNTPGRNQTKASLSPLRSRRTQSSLIARSNATRRRPEPSCINDPHKTARYMAYRENEPLYYCQKCAILLASQGFSVIKLPSTDGSIDNTRKNQVDGFLNELEGVLASLSKRVRGISGQIGEAMQSYRDEEARVEEYYNHFYEIIDEHKRRVIQELKEQFEASIRDSKQQTTKLESAINDSKRMKEDIVESLQIILNESSEEQFRPIMDNYHSNLRDYKSLTVKPQLDPPTVRRLDFKDPQAACNALDQGLQMHWLQPQLGYSKQSDCPQNPVQVIQADQKFTKSSLREIGNLFSSFDE